MKDGSEQLHRIVRQRRREKLLTQAELGRLVKAKQSAISMFEKGRADALARDKIDLIADILDIDIKTVSVPDVTARGGVRLLKYCPVAECPSNIPYSVGDHLFFKPAMMVASGDVKNLCRYCGEVLEDRCPNADCGQPLVAGACCPDCGESYVPLPELRSDPRVWADGQRRRIKEVMDLSGRQLQD